MGPRTLHHWRKQRAGTGAEYVPTYSLVLGQRYPASVAEESTPSFFLSNDTFNHVYLLASQCLGTRISAPRTSSQREKKIPCD